MGLSRVQMAIIQPERCWQARAAIPVVTGTALRGLFGFQSEIGAFGSSV
jgi:hypothetical protein